MIPEVHAEAVISHVCMVHSTVGNCSKQFLQKLRRCNYVTPKNYLDFINTYSNLLEEKEKYILGKTEVLCLCSKGLLWYELKGLREFFLLVFFSILGQCKHLEGGLDKIKEASEQLEVLNVKLAEQKVVLAEKSAACEALLEEIATNTTVGEWTPVFQI